MNVRYRVSLTDDERAELKGLLAGGKRSARKVKRAQILLAADAGESEEAIAANVRVGTSTVFRTKRRFVEGNLERAMSEEKRPGARRKLSGKEEALLVATACSAPPMGRARWTLELLAGAMVALTEHDGLSRETVRRRLRENELKPWRREMWCVPEINAEYVARMEHVLDLYEEASDPRWPLVCFDESPTQLIGEVRAPIPARPGHPQRYDSEYQRNGTMNLFVMVDVHRRWRHVEVTERRTSIDFAERMRELVDVHYPEAAVVRVVLDNLSTHAPGALYEAFEPEEARRILRRIELHFVPKHGSWLNMAEIEIGVLRGQCLDRRIEDAASLRAEIAAWEKARNDARATIEWTFTTEKARDKMGRAYPKAKQHAAASANPPAVSNATVEPIVSSPAEPIAATSLAKPPAARPRAKRAPVVLAGPPRATAGRRGKAARGPRSRFKARPTLPKQRAQKRKAAEPVKIAELETKRRVGGAEFHSARSARTTGRPTSA